MPKWYFHVIMLLIIPNFPTVFIYVYFFCAYATDKTCDCYIVCNLYSSRTFSSKVKTGERKCPKIQFTNSILLQSISNLLYTVLRCIFSIWKFLFSIQLTNYLVHFFPPEQWRLFRWMETWLSFLLQLNVATGLYPLRQDLCPLLPPSSPHFIYSTQWIGFFKESTEHFLVWSLQKKSADKR